MTEEEKKLNREVCIDGDLSVSHASCTVSIDDPDSDYNSYLEAKARFCPICGIDMQDLRERAYLDFRAKYF